MKPVTPPAPPAPSAPPRATGHVVGLRSQRDIFATQGWQRAVGEGDPAAAFLVCRAGVTAITDEGVATWLEEQGIPIQLSEAQ